MDNGAVFLYKQVPGSEISIVQIRVLSGLSNEGEYAGSGISHFLEHLLFKSTHDKDSKEVFAEIRGMGGIINGFTGMDSAAYHITVPNENLEQAVNLLSDLVMDLVFTDEEMEKERGVILREIGMYDDDPGDKRLKQLFFGAYTTNVYRYPIIGYKDRFEKIKRDDILKYHSIAYSPDRMVVGVAGGVSREDALRYVVNKFSGYKRGLAGMAAPVPLEPGQLDERTVKSEMDINLGYLAIGFHTTDLYSKDIYPMDTLAAILGEGRDSRLYQRLVRDKELLYSISAENMTPRYPGLMVITGEGDPGKLAEAREEISKVIDELKTVPMSDNEIGRIKKIVTSSFLRQKESIFPLVSTLTSSQVFTGYPDYDDKYVKEMNNVTAGDIKGMAGKYLNVENSTTSLVVPKGRDQADPSTKDAEVKVPDDPETVYRLDNGLKVILLKKTKMPMVSASIILPGGLIAETPENNGISALMAGLLTKGTLTRREGEIVPEIERMGGDIGASSGVNGVTVSALVLSGDIDKAMEIFADIIRNPSFPQEEIDKEKKTVKAMITAGEKDSGTKGQEAFLKALYAEHPYGMKASGTLLSVEGITRDEMIGFHKKYFSPAEAVLAVVGDFDDQAIKGIIERTFGGWEHKGSRSPRNEVVPVTGARRDDIETDKEEALILIGFPGIDIRDERKYALSVVGSILTGGGGWLFKELREDEGLAYTAQGLPAVMPEKGYFLFSAKTSEENIEKVKSVIDGIIKRLSSGDISAEDLASTKKKMITGHAMSLETISGLSGVLSSGEYLGLGYDDHKKYIPKINAVTLEDVVKCSREILDPENSVVVVVHSKKRG
ncbi:MAG: insulinase family protein [Candidatus Omnitrophica bacterium]|nr:insulinase family protein [Candidatus Omnitrophota bacterium]